jgi:hypothetical protein
LPGILECGEHLDKVVEVRGARGLLLQVLGGRAFRELNLLGFLWHGDVQQSSEEAGRGFTRDVAAFGEVVATWTGFVRMRVVDTFELNNLCKSDTKFMQASISMNASNSRLHQALTSIKNNEFGQRWQDSQ